MSHELMKKGEGIPAAPQKAPPEEPEILPPDPLQETRDEVETTKDEEALHEKVGEAVGNKGWSDFRLGGLLLKAKTEGWFKSHKSIGDYCEAELGFRRSKAYYLMNMYLVIVESKVTWEQVEHLGWSKVSLICGKVARLLAYAIRRKLVTECPDRVPRTRWSRPAQNAARQPARATRLRRATAWRLDVRRTSSKL